MKKLALIVPGIGYTADRPLLRLGRSLVRARGYEVLTAPYQVTLDRTLPQDLRLERCCAGAAEQVRALLAGAELEQYGEVLMVGKSLGTAVAAEIGAELALPVRQVLLTPLELTFRWPVPDGIAFTGEQDPWVAPGRIPALCRERGIPCTVFPGADHSLETGEVFRDLDILRDCLSRVEDYLRQ